MDLYEPIRLLEYAYKCRKASYEHEATPDYMKRRDAQEMEAIARAVEILKASEGEAVPDQSEPRKVLTQFVEWYNSPDRLPDEEDVQDFLDYLNWDKTEG